MSQIITFSVDKEFAGRLDGFIEQTGYKNRSLFLRDASLHFADVSIRGDLQSIDENRQIDGTAIVYFQHHVENKLSELRHSDKFQITSYHHNCLATSHTCVDTMQVSGEAGAIRDMIIYLRNINDVDKVEFVLAPFRESGCC
jgi:metal-responsive CopG/Arc/MetJ family transcriptional regulator